MTFFDTDAIDVQIEAETRAAISRGWNAAHIQWRRMILELIYETALSNPYFSQNTFREELKLREDRTGFRTPDNRAVAGVMMTAKRFGWVEPSGQAELSRVGHKTRILIWHSKLFSKYGN